MTHIAETTPATPAKARASGTLRLPQATALIVGSIIGVGIFNLPAHSRPTGRSACSRWR